MSTGLKTRTVALLRWSEKYTKTDMVYFLRGGALLSGSDAFITLISLGLSILVAAFVPKETYGMYRYVMAIANTVVMFSLTGMNSAVTRAVALGREGTFAKSLPVQFRYATLQFFAGLLVSSYYAIHGMTIYAIAFAIVAVTAPVAGVLNTYVAYLNGKKDFLRIASWKVQSGLVNIATMAAVVLNHPTVVALTLAYFLSTLLTNAWFLWNTFRKCRPSSEFNPQDISYGKHLSLMSSIGILASQLDSILVYHLLGPVALAVYSFAILIPERLRSLLNFLPNIALPRLAGRTRAELHTTARHRTQLILFATSVIALLYAAVAPTFFNIFFPQYAASIPYTMLAGLFVLVSAPGYLNTVLTAEGSYRVLYYISFLTPAVKIVLSIFLIILFGIWGAIFARLLAGAFQGILSYALIVKKEPRPE